jgi:hypothetical protein
MSARLARLVLAPISLALLSPTPPARGAEGEVGPGAYCPLPEAGEVPKCLDPAQETYGGFFGALEDEEVDEGALAPVEEAVVRGASDEHAYLALSSLTYGYYRLASRAAQGAAADPVVVERLARWNDLLSNAYAASPEDQAYRDAVRQAAEELHARAPITLPCRDARGDATDCHSTESVLRGFNAASERVGLRGALDRLMRRLLGREQP